MSTFCYVYCSICGGALDTAGEDGTRRSKIQLDDLGSLEEFEAGQSALTEAQSEEVNTWTYNSNVLSTGDIEWLFHFKVFGPDEDDLDEEPLWSTKANNETDTPGIFLSEEAKIKDTRYGEVLWVPGPAESDQTASAGELDGRPSFVHPDWILLYPRSIAYHPFERPVAHSHCLTLFDKLAKYRSQNLQDVPTGNLPLTLADLIKSLELRRLFNSDCCSHCVPNSLPRRTTQWEHYFYGARMNGWGPISWECYAGDEFYCSDPIDVAQLPEFTQHYTISAQSEPQSSENPVSDDSAAGILELPPELLNIILTSLPLRSIQALRNTCRKATCVLGNGATIWRAKAISMHGGWFWELRDQSIFPRFAMNWLQILRQIEVARNELFEKAGYVVPKFRWRQYVTRKRCWDTTYRPMLFDKKGRRKLPLGLKNRLRIWCCLESMGKDGTQISLQGQKEGIDPSSVQWDGSSEHADCPRCNREDAISFSRLKMIASKAD